MKTLLLSVLLIFSMTSLSNAQCITHVDLDNPFYLLGSPLKLEANTIEDMADDEVAYIKIEGQQLMIFDTMKELVHDYTLSFKNDFKENEDVTITYNIDELQNYTAKVAYKMANDACISCDVMIYNEAGKLVFKVRSEQLLDSYYFQ